MAQPRTQNTWSSTICCAQFNKLLSLYMPLCCNGAHMGSPGIYSLRHALLGNGSRLAKGAGAYRPCLFLKGHAQRPAVFLAKTCGQEKMCLAHCPLGTSPGEIAEKCMRESRAAVDLLLKGDPSQLLPSGLPHGFIFSKPGV